MLVLRIRDKQGYFEKISTSAERTQAGIKVAIHHFERFAKAMHDSTDEAIIDELNVLKGETKEHAVWDILQNFINYLNKQGLQPSSTSQVCNRVKAYLSYRLSIKLHNDDAKENLTQPKQSKRKHYPLKVEEIRKILDYAPPSRKALYTFLLSSGVRIMESCQIRKRDFDKSLVRYKIHIPAKYTKTKEERITFMSKEAEELVRPILDKIKDDDLVFGSNSTPFKAEQNEEMYFYRLRNKAGLVAKYESGTSKISLHSFRSFFISKCDRVDMGLGHALAGHGHYMKQYERFSDQELLEFYLKAEPKLSIYDNQVEGQEELRVEVAELRKELEETKEKQAQQSYSNALKINNSDLMASLKEEIIGQIKKDMIKEGVTNYRKNKK